MEIRLYGALNEQLKALSNTTETRVKAIGKLMDETYDQAVKNNERVIQLSEEEIYRVKNRQDILERRMEIIESSPNTTQASHTSNINPMRFNSKAPLFADGVSPMKFIKELKEFWRMMKPSNEQTAFVINSCLKGPAKDWWDLVKEREDGIDQFCDKFKRRYWGEITQHSIRTKLEFGQHQGSEDNSMVNYALNLFREAKDLEPPMSSVEIIRKLSRHFNEDIRIAILSRPISRVEDLLEMLETWLRWDR